MMQDELCVVRNLQWNSFLDNFYYLVMRWCPWRCDWLLVMAGAYFTSNNRTVIFPRRAWYSFTSLGVELSHFVHDPLQKKNRSEIILERGEICPSFNASLAFVIQWPWNLLQKCTKIQFWLFQIAIVPTIQVEHTCILQCKQGPSDKNIGLMSPLMVWTYRGLALILVHNRYK